MAAFLMTGGDSSGWPFANTLIAADVTPPETGLLRLFSGTFSFCAAVSTETALTLCVIPEAEGTDVEGVAVFFCCFFFLLALEVGGSGLGVRFGGLGVTGGGLMLPPLTVSSDEMSNMVGTERNSCCVSPPLSSSEEGGDRVNVAFPFSPTFFFLREDEDDEEERG